MWHKAIAEQELKRTHVLRHRRKEIALFRLDDGIYATDNACTHEYSSLAEGMIVDGNVYCPKHGSRFSIRNGAVLDYPAVRPVKTYQTKIEEGWIYVKL